jgi:hypothetical protein
MDLPHSVQCAILYSFLVRAEDKKIPKSLTENSFS